MAVRVCLVRHGETAWTRQKRLQGHLDIELSEHGFESVRALGCCIKDWKIDHVISSDLKRCTTTAKLLGFDVFETSPDWREADAGEWSGQYCDEVESEFPGGVSMWAEGKIAPPGGETQAAFIARLSRALQSSVLTREGVVLVISHAAAIREAVKILLNIEGYLLENPDPASVSMLDFAPRPRLRMFNVGVPLLAPEPALALV